MFWSWCRWQFEVYDPNPDDFYEDFIMTFVMKAKVHRLSQAKVDTRSKEWSYS